MNEVRTLHETAMALAEDALRLRSRGLSGDADEHLRQALQYERRAAMLLLNSPEAQPSRSILFRSAASLAMDVGEFKLAQQLSCIGMIGDPPEEILDELFEVYERSQFSRHLEVRGIALGPDQLQMALSGDAIAPGMAESAEFTRRIGAAERILIRTYERKAKIPYREDGNIPIATREKVALFVSQPRGGCFSVTLQIGGPQLALFTPPPEVIEEALTCFELWQSNDEKGLQERIPEENYRRNFSSLARELAPDGERVRFVGLTTTKDGIDRTVQLTRRTEKAAPRSGGKRPKVQTVVGTLRHADARSTDPNKHKICLVQDDETEVYIRVLSGHEDVVKTYYGDYVAITMEKARPRTGGGYVLQHVEKANRGL